MPKPPKICATCGSQYEQDTLFCPKDGTPLGSSRTVPGEDPYVDLIIGDQIELNQLIGVGSMGRVYRAFQTGVERDVAVKMLHRELSANQTLVTRFLREARISSRLTHPNVVQVVMAGQLPLRDAAGGELYIVMEYLDGISLMSALAASSGVMALPRALHIALQICDAVGEAHAQGIVHRDLKPENVMLVRRGDDLDFVKVLDFGIARLDWGEESFATQAGLIFGTARYISPEGSLGEPVSPAADVYAIATTLYQCLAGQTPFDADSPVALLMQHAYEPPPPLLSIPRASYVPSSVASVIMRNLAKTPGDRAPDARSFGRELVEAARAGGLSPDDLIPRSTLLGQRGVHASFTSIQRTKQLELSAETAAAIGARGAPPGTSTPSPEAERQSLSGSGQGSPNPSVAPEEIIPGAPTYPSQTDIARPSFLDPTLGDDDSLSSGRRSKVRLVLFVAACFLGGAAIVSAGAHQLGFLGGSRHSHVERANRALSQQHWDAPPGENVKDLTDQGLAKNPNDPALLDVRRRAGDELVTVALGRKYAGDVPGALNLAKLALELSPDNTTAQHLVRELISLPLDAGAMVEEAQPEGGLDQTPSVRSPRRDAERLGSKGDPTPPTSATPTTPTTPTAGASTPSGAEVSPPAPTVPTVPTGSPAPAATSTGGRWL